MISIVIPFVYRPEVLDMTMKCIRSIRDNSNEETEIILIQQGGPHDERFDDAVDVYLYWPHLPADVRSLAAIYNRGFSHAHGDVYVNMQNDVEMPKAWDKDLASAARDGFIGCVFVDERESDCENRGIAKAGNKYIPGCCFTISSKNWEELGGYDEQFIGWHWEDNDLFLRAAQAGGGPVRCNVTVKHRRGVTRAMNKALDDRYLLSNKELYYQKHYALFKESGMYILTLPDTANYPQGGHNNGNHTEKNLLHGGGPAQSVERHLSPTP